MRWLNIIFARLRCLARRDAVIHDLDEELRLHLELETEANLERGMSPHEARRRALLSFGNVARIKDVAYEIRGGGMLETLWQDVRFGARMLLKKPGFTVVAVLALGLGIGANTAIFSVVNTMLLRPLPFANSDRIVRLFCGNARTAVIRGELSYPDFEDYRDQARSLRFAGGYLSSGAILTGGDEPERVTGAALSAELFQVLGAQPWRGRVFTREEDQPGASPVVVLGYDFWQRRFGGDPDVIGRPLGFSDHPTIVGVMPPGFKFPIDSGRPVDYWLPLASSPTVVQERTKRADVFLNVVARLRPGANLQQAQAELSAIALRLEQQYPETNTNRRVSVIPLQEDLVQDVRPALLVLFGAVGFVLLIACANVANLSLARASTRGKEIAIRTALGAGRWRIVRQLLTESLLLSLAGGGVALLLAHWGIDLLVAASPSQIPRVGAIGLAPEVLGYTFLVSVITGLLFGLIPALQVSKTGLHETLKEGGKGGPSAGPRSRLKSALVISEVALSLVLLIGAGLLLKSFWRLLTSDPGYETDRVLTMNIPLSAKKYPGPEQQAAYFQQLIRRARELPGVEAAGATSLLPLGDSDIVVDFNVEGRPPEVEGNAPMARYEVVSPGYFDAMGMRMRRGRALTDQDIAGAPLVAVVNEAFVRRYFPGEDPLGKRLLPLDPDQRPSQVVGVVGDARQIGLDAEPLPRVYVSYLQDPQPRMDLVVRSVSRNPAELAPAVRGVVREMSKDQIIWQTRTMSELVAQSVATRRFNLVLLGLFAVVALLLAAVGIFGVMNYTVAQRSHEIGIRMALGAQKRDVLRLILGQGLVLAGIGVVIGLAGSFALTRVLETLLYDVSAIDPMVFAGVASLLTLVALSACYIPARRATRVDPMIALRHE